MTYDTSRHRIVMFSGLNDGTDLSDVWEWSGSDWALRAASGPGTRFESVIAYDEGNSKMLAFGGNSYSIANVYGDTWLWNGTSWNQPAATPISPSARPWYGMTYDHSDGYILLFGGGGLGDTWSWNNHGWSLLKPATSPPGRQEHALAYDYGRSRAVLFGGFVGGGVAADTWEWDGMTWAQLHPTTAPPARSDHMLAYDAARGNVVLFGGDDASGNMLGDTWTWDGSTWTPHTSGSSPPPRYAAMLAYDPIRERVVLFGGFGDEVETPINDTWEWDGTSWTELTPTVSPLGRGYGGMDYDPQRQRIVLFGGDSFGLLGDTWEWDGVAWTSVAPQDPAPERWACSAIYDAIDHELVMFGGLGESAGSFGDTWALSYQSGKPAERCLSATADEDGDGLAGCADSDCWGRCAPSCPPGAPCPPEAPRCGDGTCSAVEDRLICPADCM